MAIEASDLQLLVTRLERLERQNRKMHRLMFAVSGLAVLTVGLLVYNAYRSANPRFLTVEAQEFVLRDANGRERAWLGVGGDETGADVQPAAWRRIQALEQAAGLILFDEEGQEQVHLSAATGGGLLELYAEGDSTLEGGGDGITLNAPDGTLFDLKAGPGGIYLDIHDGKGQVIWQAPPVKSEK